MESVSVRKLIMKRRESVRSVGCFWTVIRVIGRITVTSVKMRAILIPSLLMVSASANSRSG
jgi:hypothetical protein